MEETQYDRMTKAPVGRLIVSLGIPTTVTMLITNVYNITDTYFVSQLGESASGATGVVFGLMAILQAIGFMFGQGAGSNISRRLGANDRKQASMFASTSFFTALGLGILVSVFGILFIEPFVRILGSTDTILPYARTYGFFILLAAPAMLVSFVMNNILRFEGRAFYGMIGVTSGALLNIFGDFFLMKILHMGIGGAGIATAVSQYVGAGILLYMFLSGKTQSQLSIRKYTKDGKDILNILAVGFPSLIRQGLASISTMLLNHVCGSYGDAAIAAMSIVERCTLLLLSIGIGIGQGFQPVAGFNYGAGKLKRVRDGFLFTLSLATCILSAFAFLGGIFAPEVMRLFVDSGEVVSIGTKAFHLRCISLVVVPVSLCGNMVFQSIGKSKIAAFLAMQRSGLFFIPAMLLLSFFFGLDGIIVAQPVADVISAISTIPYVISLFRSFANEDRLPSKG